MARERKGTIYPGPGGSLWVKFTVDVLDEHGQPVLDESTGKPRTKRDAHDLHTHDRRLATLRRSILFKELQAKGSLPKASVKEVVVNSLLFRDAAESVLGRSKIADLKSQRHRIKTWGYPLLGDLRLDQIKLPKQFGECLERCRDDGRSRQTIVHLKWDLSKVWKAICDEGWVPPGLRGLAASAKIPEGAKVDIRERAVLSDDELQVYLNFRHRNPKYDAHVLERQTLCSVARLFGGARTSELMRLKWSDFEIECEEFTRGWLVRSKKALVQKYQIPLMLRPILKMWWTKAGRPESGFLFPKVKGQGAGEDERQKHSFAHALRRDLERAFGLQKWDGDKYIAAPNAKPTRRQVELLQGTDRYLPVDFHSWRRAYCQAVAASGLDSTASKRLSSHDTEEARDRYLRSAGTALELPEGALPKSPLLLHDPSLTTSGESDDEHDDDPTPPNGPKGRRGIVQSSWALDDCLDDYSASAELVAENTPRGVPQPGRGPALGASSVFQKADEDGSQKSQKLRESDVPGRIPTDFGTIEIERLSSGATPGNVGQFEGPSDPRTNEIERLKDDSISVDSAEPRVIKGGAAAMEGAVLTLTTLMTEAIEAGDWDLAESLTQQLARVIAVRTQARKKTHRP